MKVEWKDFVKKAAGAKTLPASSAAPVSGKHVGRNNPYNMRHYSQGWLGEDSAGLNKGDMLNFSSQYYGWRAGSRLARNILTKLKAEGKVPSIRNFTPIFSPAK